MHQELEIWKRQNEQLKMQWVLMPKVILIMDMKLLGGCVECVAASFKCDSFVAVTESSSPASSLGFASMTGDNDPSREMAASLAARS
jgi:hypothetical protein